MLYVKDNKVYIKVAETYREVSITKKDKEYNVEAKKNVKPIEQNANNHFTEVNLEEAYDIVKPSKKVFEHKSNSIL